MADIDLLQDSMEKISISSFQPSVVIGENTETDMKIIFIEIAPKKDIIEVLTNYAQSCQAGLIMFRGSGLISDVTLLDPVLCAPDLPLEGPFHMTSLIGTHINSNCDHFPSRFINDPKCSSFSIYLSGNDGKLFGGIVGGKVHAAGIVRIEATLSKKPEFYQAEPMNGSLEEIEEGEPNVDGVINNVDHSAHESNNNNIVVDVSGLDDVDDNSNHPN